MYTKSRMSCVQCETNGCVHSFSVIVLTSPSFNVRRRARRTPTVPISIRSVAPDLALVVPARTPSTQVCWFLLVSSVSDATVRQGPRHSLVCSTVFLSNRSAFVFLLSNYDTLHIRLTLLFSAIYLVSPVSLSASVSNPYIQAGTMQTRQRLLLILNNTINVISSTFLRKTD